MRIVKKQEIYSGREVFMRNLIIQRFGSSRLMELITLRVDETGKTVYNNGFFACVKQYAGLCNNENNLSYLNPRFTTSLDDMEGAAFD